MVLVVALAASAIDVLTALAGSEWRGDVFEVTQPPPGWVDFCARQPSECAGPKTVSGELALSWAAWMDLVWINTWVNEIINRSPISNTEVVDRGSYRRGCGDCQDEIPRSAAC
jgi:predicted transglutaminase-like cysteine proteinase